jgi:hypothetical protein
MFSTKTGKFFCSTLLASRLAGRGTISGSHASETTALAPAACSDRMYTSWPTTLTTTANSKSLPQSSSSTRGFVSLRERLVSFLAQSSGARLWGVRWLAEVVIRSPGVPCCVFLSCCQLALYSCSEANLGSCSPSTTPMDVVVIDDTNGPFFSVQRQDLNGDGNDDLR